MKLVKGISVLFTMLLVFGALVPLTSAERDSLKVIITAEDKIYKIGDTILVEVRVFDKGVLVDADEIDVTVDTHWQQDDIDVETTQISTGVYQGSYEIQSNDNHAWFSAYVVKGTDNDRAELDIDVYQDRLELEIHFAHQTHAYVWPGESLTATITARYRGDLVDVDDFSYLRLVDPVDTMTDLNSSKVSTGTYKVTCSIPEVVENGVYELQAHATYANAHAEARAFITVNVLSVWYKLESVAGNTATFTLGVADENGDGATNAEIIITQPQYLTGTTNEEGTHIFSLTGVWDGIHIIGEVTHNGKNQSFDGYIFTADPFETPNPHPHSFDVIYEGEDFIYKSGSSVSRSYKAYNCSIPLQNKEIYYYITLEGMDVDIADTLLMPDEGSHVGGSSRIIKIGTATTNQFGAFSISFNAPSNQGYAFIYFEAGIPRHDRNYHPHANPEYDHDDGLVYEDDYDVVFLSKGDLWNSDRVTIVSDPLVIGGKTKVIVETTETLGGGDELFAKWMPGTQTSGLYTDALEGEWACWVEGGNMIYLEKSDDENRYEGHTVIPDFMSKEGDYTLAAGYTDNNGYPYVNQVQLKEGERAGGLATEMVLVLLLLTGVALVLVGLALGAFVVGKKHGAGRDLPSEKESLSSDHTSHSTEPPSSPELTPPASDRVSSSPESPSLSPDVPSPLDLDYPSPPEASEQISKPEDAGGGAGKRSRG